MTLSSKWQKPTLLVSALAVWAVVSPCRAATSYLEIQDPAGTYQYQVNYNSGTLLSGADLLSAVFGAPTDTGTKSYGYEVYTSTSKYGSVSYLDYSFGLSVMGFTVAGSTYATDPSTYDPAWNYYVAGGSGTYGGTYANTGSWTFADDGADTRNLGNGSYDGWVFGETGYPTGTTATIAGSQYQPTTADFTNGNVTVINLVPEPSRAVLMMVGLGVICGQRRRREVAG